MDSKFWMTFVVWIDLVQYTGLDSCVLRIDFFCFFVDEKTRKKSIHNTQESLVPCTVPNQFALRMSFKTLNSCYVQLKYFATCIMHATCYSNERFSAFLMYILLLQYELNLNSFIYLNKIYNNDCCEVKPFEFVSLF